MGSGRITDLHALAGARPVLPQYNSFVTRVCAVVVTRNRKDLLRQCLRSVLAQARPVDRILVVDNASTDGTGEMLDAEFVRFAELGILARLNLRENAGGAGGVGAGMRWAHCNNTTGRG